MTTWTGTAASLTAGTTTLSAPFNTNRDAIKALSEAWTSYTPTWTGAGSNPAIGNGTLVGKYARVNKLILYRIQLTMGSTTTYGTGNWGFALPVAAHADYTANMHLGNGVALDVSAVAYGHLFAAWLTSTSIFVFNAAPLATGVPWAWATGDKVSVSGTYEAA